jgi:hypothetical protein
MRTTRPAWLALGVALLISGCQGGASVADEAPPPPTSQPTAPASAPTTPAAPPTQAPPAPRPTATPRSPVELEVTAVSNPPTPSVGSQWVLQIGITNHSSRQVDGVRISTGGPWDQQTILGVLPEGSLKHDPSGWYIVSPTPIPPGETHYVQVVARANSEGDQQFTFGASELVSGDAN